MDLLISIHVLLNIKLCHLSQSGTTGRPKGEPKKAYCSGIAPAETLPFRSCSSYSPQYYDDYGQYRQDVRVYA